MQQPASINNIGVVMFTVTDQDAALAFYTEKLGFEVRGDSRFGENGEHRWLEVAPPGSTARLALNPSMGGGQALTIGLKHLDTFAWVGGFSSALFGNQAQLAPSDAGKKLRLLWLSCGDTDRLMDASKTFHTSLEDKKVAHIWHIDAGGHTWPVWKNDLYHVSTLLFR